MPRRALRRCRDLVFSSGAAAQDYPSKPIKLIVPTAAAGIGDIIARQMQQKLGEASVTIVVENRPGAAGVIGTNEVARAPADGYTFLVGNHAVLAMLPHLQKIPYDPFKSFTPVFLAVTVPNILVVHPSVPAKNVKELIAYAKANPGKLTYASQGVGASGHIAGELFKLHAGVDITHVPYKGAAPAAQDLAAGHVSMMFDVVSLALGSIHAGPGAAAWRRDQAARRRAAGSADHGRAGHAGRGRRLVRLFRAGRHAAVRRSPG